MNVSLFFYFFSYIFRNKTRQKLIFLAIVGLLISSFSLTVLQGVMGGLQHGLVTRSKTVLGYGYIDVSKLSIVKVIELSKRLSENSVLFTEELELELMIQNGNYISPIILHAMNFKKYVPLFLQNKDKTDLIVGSDLGRELRSFYGSNMTLTSPAHIDLVLREMPRQGGSLVSDFFSSELPEIDGVHGWIRLSFLQNMIRKRAYNKFRIFSDNINIAKKIINESKYEAHFVSWEEQNSTLVFALNLETKVMLFLFVATSFLIGICITSGFLIFYNKVKIDLASFWILGLSKEKILGIVYKFGQLITVVFCLLGVVIGAGFLYLLDTNNFILMPDHFVERNIPVKLEWLHVVTAFIVPYSVSSVFTHYTFKVFKKENYSFISLIKKVG